jgi:hypothetical protein
LVFTVAFIDVRKRSLLHLGVLTLLMYLKTHNGFNPLQPI